jgi:hypothetical protein
MYLHGTKAVTVVSGAAEEPEAAASEAAEVVAAESVLAAELAAVLAAVSAAVLAAVSAAVLEAAVESCRLTGEADTKARSDSKPNAGPSLTIVRDLDKRAFGEDGLDKSIHDLVLMCCIVEWVEKKAVPTKLAECCSASLHVGFR